MISNETRLRSIIASLKRGDCWCEMGVGNPMVRGHSQACLDATDAMCLDNSRYGVLIVGDDTPQRFGEDLDD